MPLLIQRCTILAAVAISLSGCTKESPVGGPGAKSIGNTFTLVLPRSKVHLKHNEEQVITIGIDRGPDFKEDVKLRFNSPAGIHVALTSPFIKSTQNEKQVLIEAVDAAAEGNAVVEVIAEPTSGTSISMELTVKVGAD